MTAWARQVDPLGAALLEQFARAAEPFLLAAAADAPGDPLWLRAYPGDRIVVAIGYEKRQFRSTADGDIGLTMAGALGDVLTAGLNRLPADARRAVAKRLKGDSATLAVHFDPCCGDLIGLIVGDAAEVALFSLRSGDAN